MKQELKSQERRNKILEAALKELKEVNYSFAKNIFQKLNLCKGITIQEAMDYFNLF